MASWATLLRGVNIAGKNSLPMASFRALLNDLGYQNVMTYIQSGNAVFEAPGNADEISHAIGSTLEIQFGFRPDVITLPTKDLDLALEENPFKSQADTDGSKVHLFFLDGEVPTTFLNDEQNYATADEKTALIANVLYMYTPNGFGRSKLAAHITRTLPVPATARNARSVTAIAALARKLLKC